MPRVAGVRQARATARAHAGIRSPRPRARLARLSGLYAIVGGSDRRRRGRGDCRRRPARQLRLRRASGAVLEAARRIVALAARHALVIGNDRADLALLAGADGVHLGDEDGRPRRRGGSGRTCSSGAPAGRSTRRAATAAGPITSASASISARAEAARRGAARRRGARGGDAGAARAGQAIGGIDASNARDVARAGAARAAVIDALFGVGDPRENAARLAAAFEAGGLPARKSAP